MPNRPTLAILVTAISISAAMAQTHGAGSGNAGFGISAGAAGTGPVGSGSTAMGRGGFGGPTVFHQGRRSGRGAILLAYPYFDSDSNAGYDPPQAAQPQVIVVPAAAPVSPPPPPAPRESLLIEWQGDRFVRTTMSAKAPDQGQVAPDYSEKSAPPLSATGRVAPESRTRHASEAAQRELPPAVLVFHDGRTEEVSEYTIMSGTIYSKADYWTSGSWTKRIQVADLDVPATLRRNQERGVKFVLPASPNEVVVRP